MRAPITTLKRRADFMRIRGGGRFASAAFVLEGKPRERSPSATPSGDQVRIDGPRFGFTVTRKLGTAVVRNRIRRRLREALRATVETSAQPGFDYVIVARTAAEKRPFGDLVQEFRDAFERVHGGRRARPGVDRGGPHSGSGPPKKRRQPQDPSRET